jgi:hypothetical protein
MVREHASCLDTDNAQPTVGHIPAGLIPERDRKLKAEVDLLGPGDELLERSKIFDVHFPKTKTTTSENSAKVWVDPQPLGIPGKYEVVKAAAPKTIAAEQPKVAVATLPIDHEIRPPDPSASSKTNDAIQKQEKSTIASLPGDMQPSNANVSKTSVAGDAIGVLPSALDGEGHLTHWANSTASIGSGAWWQLAPSADPLLKVSFSQSRVFFPAQGMLTASQPTTIVVTNAGSSTMRISHVTISGIDAGDFTQINDCVQSLGPEATCTISVLFVPTSSGTRIATLAIGTSQKIALSGIGK